ncbi:hypothetical protein GH714_034986 [Hevea brasiliensis]|uniref:Uncharacterized protein n=1 Tax=Hevea brasiliensis TaxID=3981 RepID=A0A6A6L756_HEVBR|nr:hypothetical protein GH714_034986 [Hevea brasiliensis]
MNSALMLLSICCPSGAEKRRRHRESSCAGRRNMSSPSFAIVYWDREIFMHDERYDYSRDSSTVITIGGRMDLDIVAENFSPTRDTLPFYAQSMELDPFPSRAAAGVSPTLGQLLKRVGDVRKEATGDGNETPIHQVLELDDTNSDVPSSIPFSFIQ